MCVCACVYSGVEGRSVVCVECVWLGWRDVAWCGASECVCAHPHALWFLCTLVLGVFGLLVPGVCVGQAAHRVNGCYCLTDR